MAEKDSRSKAQIEADINSARVRLAANLEGLVDEIHPQAIKKRKTDELKADVEKAKQFARGTAEDAKAQFVHEDGSIRMDRIALIAGVVVGVATLAIGTRVVVGKVRKR